MLTLVQSHPVLQNNDAEQLPIVQNKYILIKRMTNDRDQKRVERNVKNCDDVDSDEDSDCGDDLESSEAKYRFIPYFRIRHISHHPLSNYADSYDHFPTVA